MLTFLTRLEAATSRLEDMVPNMGDANGTTSGAIPTEDATIGAAGGTDQTRNAVTPQPLVEALNPAIDDFDAIINGHVSTFVNMSEDIGGLIAEQVGLLYSLGCSDAEDQISLLVCFAHLLLNGSFLLSLQNQRSLTFNHQRTWIY